MMSRGTQHRTIRIAPELWERAREVAAQRGETLSDVIRQILEAYVADPETPPSQGEPPMSKKKDKGKNNRPSPEQIALVEQRIARLTRRRKISRDEFVTTQNRGPAPDPAGFVVPDFIPDGTEESP